MVQDSLSILTYTYFSWCFHLVEILLTMPQKIKQKANPRRTKTKAEFYSSKRTLIFENL